jgi:hypothetical protein
MGVWWTSGDDLPSEREMIVLDIIFAVVIVTILVATGMFVWLAVRA